MNVLYIASDVFFPESNGGARRAYGTSRIFLEHGHNVSILVNRRENEPEFQIIENIHVYRIKMIELGVLIRKYMGSLKIIFSRILRHTPKEKIIKNTQLNYASYYRLPNIKQEINLKSKITEIYRHKLPIHKWLKILPAEFKIWNIIKKEKIDIIIERGPSYGIGALISKLTNRIYIVDFIDAMYSDIALKSAHLVLSYFTTNQIPNYVKREKIQRVYTVADEKQFKPIPKNLNLVNKLGLNNSDRICIYIGAMYSWHGLDTIVKAMKILTEKGKKEIKTILVGDGTERKKILDLVEELDLKSQILLPGKVPFEEVPNYLSLADIALSLNTSDSIGFKLIEYMAAGKAIITTNVDIVHLIARNNKDLLFTPPNDPEILADNILKILNDQELKKQFEVNVRNKVEKKFTWNAHYFNIIKGLKNKLKI